ncbi:uncharacterized [Tachysurus ichikawai]
MEVDDCSASNADRSFMVVLGIRHNLLQKDVKEERRDAYANCCLKPVSNGSIVKDCTNSFVVQDLVDSVEVGADGEIGAS